MTQRISSARSLTAHSTNELSGYNRNDSKKRITTRYIVWRDQVRGCLHVRGRCSKSKRYRNTRASSSSNQCKEITNNVHGYPCSQKILCAFFLHYDVILIIALKLTCSIMTPTILRDIRLLSADCRFSKSPVLFQPVASAVKVYM